MLFHFMYFSEEDQKWQPFNNCESKGDINKWRGNRSQFAYLYKLLKEDYNLISQDTLRDDFLSYFQYFNKKQRLWKHYTKQGFQAGKDRLNRLDNEPEDSELHIVFQVVRDVVRSKHNI